MTTPLPIEAPNRRSNVILIALAGKNDELKMIALLRYHKSLFIALPPFWYQSLLKEDRLTLRLKGE